MRNRWPILFLLVLGALFAFGLYHLVQLRYQVGDVYPEYSSLRSDPLGTMALYESLQQLPGISVRRDFTAEGRMPEEKGASYLHLAASRWDWATMPEETVHEIEGFLTRGGRLVITFLPETAVLPRGVSRPVPVPARKPSAKAKAEQDRLLRRTSLTHRWGFEFDQFALASSGNQKTRTDLAVNESDFPLPRNLAWHSSLIFTNLDPAWQVVYARHAHPVIIERHFGPGSVVMSTDSYYLSNEALTRNRHADLLAWLIGSGQCVYFDEAHLGILESPGIATLMRRYRLQGFGLGLLVLALLFVWKNSASFLPPYRDEEQTQPVLGREAAAGFVNLLRRNIPQRDLLQVCFDQWTRSLLQSGHQSIAHVDQAQAAFEAENARAKVERDPVRAYREICQALARPSAAPATQPTNPSIH